MSGGVDSSVAAYIMKENGYTCIGVTMKLFNNDDVGMAYEKSCCSIADTDDAKSVSDRLGIDHFVFNFADDFKKHVIERFISAYENGLTPNPCIDCNRFIKFKRLAERAEQLECDTIVTGHYAVTEHAANGRYLLKKAPDNDKDQSYVLYSMTQEQLKHSSFPLGGYKKSEVRKIAEQNGFVNSAKRDSQDICFVRDGNYADFIKQYTGKEYPAGDFVDKNGGVLGTHKGCLRYTIGQRKGLGLALPASMFVVSKSLDENKVVLGFEEDLYSKSVHVTDINLIAYEKLDKPIRAKVKCRYKQSEQPAVVTQTDGDNLVIEFDEPQRAVTPGQAAVIYDGDYVIGGGTIV
jgi:tRNA-specific 2-thiouridylase